MLSYPRTPEITAAFKDFVVERDGFEPSVRPAIPRSRRGRDASIDSVNAGNFAPAALTPFEYVQKVWGHRGIEFEGSITSTTVRASPPRRR